MSAKTELDAIDVEILRMLMDLHEPKHPVNTKTTIVLSTLFEKPGLVPAEPD